MLISYIEFFEGLEKLTKISKFDDNVFFFFLLPPIIFATGYSLQLGEFFKNIKNILILGLFGTIITFTSFSLLTIAFNRAIPMSMYKRMDDGSY